MGLDGWMNPKYEPVKVSIASHVILSDLNNISQEKYFNNLFPSSVSNCDEECPVTMEN